jgi:hypothetical protein
VQLWSHWLSCDESLPRRISGDVWGLATHRKESIILKLTKADVAQDCPSLVVDPLPELGAAVIDDAVAP